MNAMIYTYKVGLPNKRNNIQKQTYVDNKTYPFFFLDL